MVFFEKFAREHGLRLLQPLSGKPETIWLAQTAEGEKRVLRRYAGQDAVCRKLVGVQTPQLAQVYACQDADEDTVSEEEYIDGTLLSDLLRQTLLDERQAGRRGARALHCAADAARPRLRPPGRETGKRHADEAGPRGAAGSGRGCAAARQPRPQHAPARHGRLCRAGAVRLCPLRRAGGYFRAGRAAERHADGRASVGVPGEGAARPDRPAAARTRTPPSATRPSTPCCGSCRRPGPRTCAPCAAA